MAEDIEDDLNLSFRLMHENLNLNQNQQQELISLFQRIKRITKLIERSHKKQTSAQHNMVYLQIMGNSYPIDMEQHIEATKIVLDKFIQNFIEQQSNDEVLLSHRKLSNLLTHMKKQLIQPKQSVLSDQKTQEQNIYIHRKSSSATSLNNLNNLQNSHKLWNKDDYKQKNQSDDENDQNQGELKKELEDEILDLSKRMKSIATNINEQLEQDNKVIQNIDKKQDQNMVSVKNMSGKLSKFMASKSLSCTTLFLMFAFSLSLMIFTIIFIKIT